jgi:two-component system LytT family sensor kinase
MQATENTMVHSEESFSNTRAGLRYPGRLGLFVVWTIIGFLAFARHLPERVSMPSIGHLLLEFAGWLTCYYPWVLFGPIVFRLEQRFPLDRGRWMRSLPLLFFYGALLAFAAMKVTLALNLMLERNLDLHRLLFSTPISETAVAFFLFWTTAAAGAIIRTIIHLENQQRVAAALALENAKLEASLKHAELEALRLRLKPHFLFNTLENISSLAEDNPRLARRMLSRLGELLRAAFRRDFQAEISLNSEIALMNAYIDVERVRFGERLVVDVDIAPETEAALVPSLLLQPLVENAILHGLRDVTEFGRIEVRSVKNFESLVLTVKDNGSGPPHQTLDELPLGIGLGSTQERLRRMYPRNHDLSVQQSDDGGTLVHIQLPFRTRNTA